MSTVEAIVTPWIASPADLATAARRDLTASRPPDRHATVAHPAPATARTKVGMLSLRQIVDSAVAEAEGDAIRRALATTNGNKSQAARLLRTNYTTLHVKMRRYQISPRPFQR
ncbi:MAG TPA: helix-turn-helix domain-containing protein [Methylomirabilota bacterium]|nr:helix-turn-helix domain-containing protein [Methylomirabilota bacterium]